MTDSPCYFPKGSDRCKYCGAEKVATIDTALKMLEKGAKERDAKVADEALRMLDIILG